MNIRCPHCQTVFRVNPDRIPPTGVRAKCARCGDSFLVTPPAGAAAGAAARPDRPAPTPSGAATAAAPHRPATIGARAPAAEPRSVPRPTTPAPSAPAELQATRPAPGGAAAAPAASSAGPRPPAPTAPPSFGAKDPRVRAERLARALVSDIVAYHPDRRDQSLERGNLRTEFREEIMKSWEEYVAQVGIDVAKSTPYFRDALNGILAKGQKIF